MNQKTGELKITSPAKELFHFYQSLQIINKKFISENKQKACLISACSPVRLFVCLFVLSRLSRGSLTDLGVVFSSGTTGKPAMFGFFLQTPTTVLFLKDFLSGSVCVR